MDPRERFARTITHEPADRPPIVLWATPEIRRQLETHFAERFGETDVDRMLEVDLRVIQPPFWDGTKPTKPIAEDMPSGSYQDIAAKPLAWIKTVEDVARYKPVRDPEAFDFAAFAEECRAALPYVRVFGSAGVTDIVNGLGARGRGLEDLLCEIMDEDPVALALIDQHMEYEYEYCRRGMEAAAGQVDVLYIGEDCGNQRGPLFPPEFFRRFFAARLKRFADLAHRHGAACMLHSCGSVRQLYPILIHEVGVDIHDSCQPEAEGMEPAGLKRDFGSDITFCGMLSLQKTLTRGTPEQCRDEAKQLVDQIGRDGGYIFAPANTITCDSPLENILAAYEAVLDRPLQ